MRITSLIIGACGLSACATVPVADYVPPAPHDERTTITLASGSRVTVGRLWYDEEGQLPSLYLENLPGMQTGETIEVDTQSNRLVMYDADGDALAVCSQAPVLGTTKEGRALLDAFPDVQRRNAYEALVRYLHDPENAQWFGGDVKAQALVLGLRDCNGRPAIKPELA